MFLGQFGPISGMACLGCGDGARRHVAKDAYNALSEGPLMSNDRKNDDIKKSQKVELVFDSYEGRKTTAVQFPWRNSIERVAAQNHFYDTILALAELPPREELPKILAVSQHANIPSIWQRVRPSPLESDAAALLTALAFSSREHRTYIVDQFLEAHNLVVDLRGRPRVTPDKTMAMVRGLQVQKIMLRLRDGFQMVDQARRKGEFGLVADAIASQMRTRGYEELEIRILVDAKSLQDAACKYFVETNPGLKEQKGEAEARTKRLRTV